MTDEPSNVVPMRGHTHECSSCHAQIVTERLYEGHTDECRQPEIRMRRAEARILELINAVNTQTENVEALISRLDQLVFEHWGANLLPNEHYGKPQDTEPDTKRSGDSARVFAHYGPGSGCVRCQAGDSVFSHSYTGAAEPPGEAPAGAEPAPGGPERPR